MKEAKVREFLTLNKESLSVHEYGLKFTKLYHYAPELVKDIISTMSLCVAELGRISRKEGQATILIGDMEISRLMVYVQHVEEEKLRDREELRNKKAKIGNEFGYQKGNVNRLFFQKQKGHALSSTSAPVPWKKMSFMDRVKVVWHKEVVGLLHVLGAVDTSQVSVVMGSQVATSAVKRVSS